MKIGIIGTGNIGTTLGRAWVEAGHDVVFGVRSTKAPKVTELLDSLGKRAKAKHVDRAIAAADVVLLAVPGKAVDELIRAYAAEFDGKIVIDATNSVGQPVLHNVALLQGGLPKSKVFRAFSTLGVETLANPVFGDERADLFFCGDPGEAQETVAGLIRDVGLRPIYVGGPEAVPLLGEMTRLWFTLVMSRGYGRRTAFRLLTEEK